MDKQKTIETIRSYLLSKNIKKAALFGSFVRDDFGPKSDIDILIEALPGMTLFDVITIENDLKKKIKRKIDLGEFDGLKKNIREGVLSEAVQII